MKPPFPEFVPDKNTEKDDLPGLEEEADAAPASGRLRDVPLRMLVPNLITLGAICSGLTAIRLAFESRFELAIVAIVFAAVLDGLDGRVARFLKSETSFGEQMDSLADFVNFGVAPALVLYLWILGEMRSFGWIVALIYSVCGCLRLARFNVMLDAPDKPSWQKNFFTGVPAPAGALLVLLPVYLGLLGLEKTPFVEALAALYTLGVAFLMVSNIPTWSGKQLSGRVSRGLVLPLMLGILLLVVFLFSYPWLFLTILCFSYLATIPFSYRDWDLRDAPEEPQAAG